MPRSLTHHPNHRSIISYSYPHERRNMRSVWPNREGGVYHVAKAAESAKPTPPAQIANSIRGTTTTGTWTTVQIVE